MTQRSIRAGMPAQGVKSKVRKTTRSMIIPKTAAEKVIFRRNSTQSMLLRLPSEIRNRVWTFVLGDQLLHIQGDSISNGRYNGNESVLRARCCICPYTERKLFEQSMRNLSELVEMGEPSPESKFAEIDNVDNGFAFNLDFSTLDNSVVLEDFDFDSYLNQSGSVYYDHDWSFSPATEEVNFVSDNYFLVPDTGPATAPEDRRKMLKDALRKHPHATCTAMLSGTSSHTPQRGLALQLLQTCRQVYTEASAVMWTTNTFSFSRPDDFKRFINDRPRFVRAMIAKLHFDVNSQRIVLADWKRTLRRPALARLLAELKSLKALHFHQTLWSDTDILTATSSSLEAFGPFNLMPLQDVTVTTTDAITWLGPRSSWTDEDRITFVENLRRDLLA